MKAVLFSLLVLSVTASLASEMVGDFPKISFGTVAVPVNEICVQGEFVKTINQFPACVSYGRGDSSDCTREVMRYLSAPINDSIPLHYEIRFGYQTDRGFSNVETRDYDVAACLK